MWATILGTLIFYELGCVLEESRKRKQKLTDEERRREDAGS